MIDGYLDHRNGIGKESAQEMRIEKITDKEKDVPLCGDLRMLPDKRIGKIGVILREQKKPPEEEVGDRSIVAYFLREHISFEMGSIGTIP